MTRSDHERNVSSPREDPPSRCGPCDGFSFIACSVGAHSADKAL